MMGAHGGGGSTATTKKSKNLERVLHMSVEMMRKDVTKGRCTSFAFESNYSTTSAHDFMFYTYSFVALTTTNQTIKEG